MIYVFLNFSLSRVTQVNKISATELRDNFSPAAVFSGIITYTRKMSANRPYKDGIHNEGPYSSNKPLLNRLTSRDHRRNCLKQPPCSIHWRKTNPTGSYIYIYICRGTC